MPSPEPDPVEVGAPDPVDEPASWTAPADREVERDLAGVADWGPAEDWSGWAEASG